MIRSSITSATRPVSRLLSFQNNGIIADKAFCYATLTAVSRSFEMVIQQLPTNLRDEVCVFYLVLRALDSVEDDMSIDASLKGHLLSNFHDLSAGETHLLKGLGETPEYQKLLNKYSRILNVFQSLDLEAQHIIKDVCREMGAGMLEFSNREIASYQDFDKYCYYVAGLVGLGLSRLFVNSGLEGEELKNVPHEATSMGLFLQKVNIIRDVKEDWDEGRIFWPQASWEGKFQNLNAVFKAGNREGAIEVLDNMILSALHQVKDCMAYLEKIQDPSIFRFCAIPQVMAMATLSEVFRNPRVFETNVKIPKALTLKISMTTRNLENARQYFLDFSGRMLARNKDTNPEIVRALQGIQQTCSANNQK